MRGDFLHSSLIIISAVIRYYLLHVLFQLFFKKWDEMPVLVLINYKLHLSFFFCGLHPLDTLACGLVPKEPVETFNNEQYVRRAYASLHKWAGRAFFELSSCWGTGWIWTLTLWKGERIEANHCLWLLLTWASCLKRQMNTHIAMQQDAEPTKPLTWWLILQ